MTACILSAPVYAIDGTGAPVVEFNMDSTLDANGAIDFMNFEFTRNDLRVIFALETNGVTGGQLSVDAAQGPYTVHYFAIVGHIAKSLREVGPFNQRVAHASIRVVPISLVRRNGDFYDGETFEKIELLPTTYSERSIFNVNNDFRVRLFGAQFAAVAGQSMSALRPFIEFAGEFMGIQVANLVNQPTLGMYGSNFSGALAGGHLAVGAVADLFNKAVTLRITLAGIEGDAGMFASQADIWAGLALTLKKDRDRAASLFMRAGHRYESNAPAAGRTDYENWDEEYIHLGVRYYF